ncbi:MAG: HAD family phosphatase [Clostridia bacterium]|nr:HAD family phosphatase [Clostridia bacterium]
MKYKLFVSDYDGTLGQAPKNDIDADTLQAINKFIEKGGIFAVCSGRETSSITKILRSAGLKGLVASFQGARISDIESGEYIFNGGLTSEQAIEILHAVEKTGLSPIGYGENEIFYSKKDKYIKYYQDNVGITGRIVDMEEELKRQGKASKICFLGDDKLVNKTAMEMNERFKDKNIKFNSGATCLLEAINPDCGKGQAVKFMADYYNIPLDEVITVGDSTNDIDLIKGPWHGVAVGDAREELKAVAKEITVPFKDKPIKTLLEKYCL